MEPLDLRTRPPRGPRESLDGLMLMPRTIDKIRATLPGGNLGPYHVAFGLSATLLEMIGVSLDELTSLVARAADEDEIAGWLREHADVSQYERANALISSTRGSDVPAAHRARFESLYSERLRREHPVNFDLLEADDRELYPAYRPEATAAR